jgi:hypothetical protein
MDPRAERPDETIRDRDFENDLLTLRGVRRANVQVNATGITSVRVLVVPESNIQRTTSDIESVAVRRGVTLPDGAIEILGASNQSENAPRRRFAALVLKREDEHFHAQVALRRNGDALIGEADAVSLDGPSVGSEMRAVADATIDALRIFFGEDAAVQAVRKLDIGKTSVCMVLVRVGEEMYVGSAIVRKGEHDAVARATLDAVNRPLTSP